MIEDKIKAMLGEFHWNLLVLQQKTEDQQKEIENLKNSTKDNKKTVKKVSD